MLSQTENKDVWGASNSLRVNQVMASNGTQCDRKTQFPERKSTMFKIILSSIMLAMLVNQATAQDANAMNAAFNQQQNGQMQTMTRNIVQTRMNDPYVQQQYRIYQQQGGQLDFPNYCFRYAETGGFTPHGTQRAINSSNQIHNQDMDNYQRYVDGSRALSQETYDWRNNVQDKWARQRGENLTAQSTYVNGSTGASWQLPNNAFPGQVFRDYRTGTAFMMGAQGQYWMNNGQGWQAMQYQQ